VVDKIKFKNKNLFLKEAIPSLFHNNIYFIRQPKLLLQINSIVNRTLMNCEI